METIEYTYGRRKIVVEVVYSNRSTLGLQVFPLGNVIATAPMEAPLEKITNKIKPKSRWILQQQQAFELLKPFTPERQYIPGETHRYLGRQYKLRQSSEREKDAITLRNGELIVGNQVQNIERAIKSFYKIKADIYFSAALNKVIEQNPIFKPFEINLKHKFLAKRWGSCATNGNILLNTELIKASKGCIDYVIQHELCHLIHPNHTKEFYKLLSEINPNWMKYKLQLEKTVGV